MDSYQGNTAADNFSTAKEFSVGSVLGRTFSTLFGKIGLFCGLTFIASLVVFLLALLLPSQDNNDLLEKIVNLIMNSMVQSSMAYAVFQVLRGFRVTLGESLSYGVSRMLPVIFTSLLMGIAVAFISFGGVLMIYALKGFGLFLFLLSMLLIVMLMCIWAVAIPGCTVEKLGPLESLTRSAELTRGYRWKVFALILVTYAIIAALGAFIGVIASSHMVFAILSLFLLLLPQAFMNVMTSIMYFDLRTVKEGIGLDALADVFD